MSEPSEIDYKSKYEQLKQEHNRVMDILMNAGLQLQVLASNSKARE